jgi:hypothetical protein
MCSNGSCVVGCTNAANCPTGDICSSGRCVGCVTDSDCTAPATCQSNSCVCPTPVITGVTVSASWPSPLQFTFAVTNEGSSGSFQIPWRALGSTGMVAVSGFLPTFPLPNNLWPSTPQPNFPDNNQCTGQPCCANFNFGCPQAGCGGTPAPNVEMQFTGVTVTNPCGATSVPTCFTFPSLCPGSSMTGTPNPC